MLRLVFVLSVIFLLAFVCSVVSDEATAQSPTEWYTLDKLLGECQKFGGTPADTIESSRQAGIPYTMDDVVEKGVVVQTTMTIPGTGVKVTFYRGKERCAQALASYKEGEEKERRKADKYR